jgi:hypothetical protein
MSFCGSQEFATRALSYGGYDTHAVGTVIWNA